MASLSTLREKRNCQRIKTYRKPHFLDWSKGLLTRRNTSAMWDRRMGCRRPVPEFRFEPAPVFVQSKSMSKYTNHIYRKGEWSLRWYQSNRVHGIPIINKLMSSGVKKIKLTNQTPKKSIVTSRTENVLLKSVACFHATLARKESGLVNQPLTFPNKDSLPVVVICTYVSRYILYKKGICW